MLAKQGWRLIQNQESLCARILKAKYFPNSDFLSAKAKAGCSYTWLSIVQGLLEIIKDGVIWRIGNGQNVDIWKDPWLPRGMTWRPMTPRGRNLMQKVEELIDSVTEDWDVQLLSQTFWEEDVKLIRSIPVHVDMDMQWVGISIIKGLSQSSRHTKFTELLKLSGKCEEEPVVQKEVERNG